MSELEARWAAALGAVRGAAAGTLLTVSGWLLDENEEETDRTETGVSAGGAEEGRQRTRWP